MDFIKVKGLIFSKEEFTLITALSFGPMPKCDKKSLRIRDTYFKGENNSPSQLILEAIGSHF